MVVLHKIRIDSGGFSECLPTVTFKEKPPIVAENMGLQQNYIRNSKWNGLHDSVHRLTQQTLQILPIAILGQWSS